MGPLGLCFQGTLENIMGHFCPYTIIVPLQLSILLNNCPYTRRGIINLLKKSFLLPSEPRCERTARPKIGQPDFLIRRKKLI